MYYCFLLEPTKVELLTLCGEIPVSCLNFAIMEPWYMAAQRHLFLIIFFQLTLFVLPSAGTLFWHYEFWPFSTYDMYSRPIFKQPRQTYQITSITATNKEVLLGDMEALFPLGPHCINNCIERIINDPKSLHMLLLYYINKCNNNPSSCRLTEPNVIGAYISNVEVRLVNNNTITTNLKSKIYEVYK